ncbi:hypothetical protein DRJ86_03615 [Enterococcus faecalis]|nr:hypothetical protein DRJ86_03615 [Enterococcus faecalis]RTK28044.1 hypothetical protein DRJ92_03615 [Enterococcus faecalis]RTK39343.1 hypothetical protein DRJ76_03620 [Enterococcus faecalis]RTK47511.1 hypothetical protein DRJ75_03615 [Enterococcus faecalis]RTK72622.1 hypothetical protein DRJ81_01905 [Enterococcus faecalis]
MIPTRCSLVFGDQVGIVHHRSNAECCFCSRRLSVFLSLGQKSKVIFVPGPILFSFTILLFLKDFLNNSKKK